MPPEANIEEVVERPEGTVATIAIQTNKANNTTTFTILPRLGRSPGQSFLVKTNNLSQATKLIKPLHLDRLPVFKNLFHNIKVVPPTGTQKSSLKSQSRQNFVKKPHNISEVITTFGASEKKSCSRNAENLEADFIQELKEHDVHYENISITKNEKGKLIWHCPEENCSRYFVKRSQLKLHVFSHNKIKPFQCSKEGCTWAFPTIVKLKRHEQSHQGLKLFKCNLPGCEDRSFTTIYNLNTHIKDHVKDDQFQCELCENTFKTQRTLDLHIRNSHRKEAFIANYFCKECLKPYFTKTDYVRHMKMAHDDSVSKANLKCDTCDKEFQKLSLLKSHEMIHTGQRPYVCKGTVFLIS